MDRALIGGEALVASLVGAGVDVCFMNPGTSEMHFVRALDAVPEMRGVLTLFEGVATGAADGYARIAGKPAAVLLHLGPGLGNGLANLHNARKAHTPVVVVVGGHATFHDRYDAPLQADIEAFARPVSGFVHTSGHPRDVAHDAMRAVEAAQRGLVATLVLPADVSWEDGAQPAAPRPAPVRPVVAASTIAEAAGTLRAAGSATLVLGASALTETGLRAAARIAQATGAKLLAESFPARMERGAGRPAVERIAYLGEEAEKQLAGSTDLVLCGASSPVTFFAYPGRRSDLVPDGCTVHRLAGADEDAERALTVLADELAPEVQADVAEAQTPELPDGPLSPRGLAAAVAATLPDDAILVDEAITVSAALAPVTATAARHTLLTLTGGAIGQGLPVATGAALAAPGRRVVAVQADGSAMYTIQSLWTQARESLDVTTVLINNSAYAILRFELDRVGAGAGGPKAHEMLDLRRPDLDFSKLAQGLGVDAVRVETAAELAAALRHANRTPGPHLVEAMIRA